MAFHHQHCVPCEGGISRLSAVGAEALVPQVPLWRLEGDASRLTRSFAFPDYSRALAFVTAISAIAESEGHHPDVCFGWGYVTVSLHTHAIGGLHGNDFILAAKFDRVTADAATLGEPRP